MTGTDLFRDAAGELYSADPDAFVERRGALAAQARAAGDAAAARKIAGLRKPTRSAWVVNRLIRAAPEVPGELAGLGGELLAAQRSLDGRAITELSLRRRKLIETLVRRALRAAGQQAPPAALRDEVAATLSAAVADPGVAGQLAEGTLVRPVRSEGFAAAAPPVLSLVRGGADVGSRRARAPGPAGAGQAEPGKAAPRKTVQAQARERAQARAGARAQAAQARTRADAQARAEREQRRQEAVAQAEQAVAEAGQAAAAATAAEHEQESLVERLELELADARQALAQARAAARRARNRQRQARQAADRLRP